MEWHELPKYNGIQVSQLIYKAASKPYHILFMMHDGNEWNLT